MTKDEKVDGARIAAKILSRMAPENRSRVMKAMTARDPEVMLRVKEAVFTFNDIPSLNGPGLQLVANTVEHKDLVLSLSNAPKEVQKAFLENMSTRKAKLVSEDIQALPAQPTQLKKDVEEARRKILDIIEKLRGSGQIRTHDNSDTWV